MFGSNREFADNNSIGIHTLKEGICGLFEYLSICNSTVKTIGEITAVDEYKAVNQK